MSSAIGVELQRKGWGRPGVGRAPGGGYWTRVQVPSLISSMRKAERSKPRWSSGVMVTTPVVPARPAVASMASRIASGSVEPARVRASTRMAKASWA